MITKIESEISPLAYLCSNIQKILIKCPLAVTELCEIAKHMTDDKGNTVLHYLAVHACSESDYKLIQTLINQGQDLTQKNADGMAAFHLACLNNNNLDVVKLLFSFEKKEELIHRFYYNEESKNFRDGLSLLSLLCAKLNTLNNSARIKTMQFLIEQGADVNSFNHFTMHMPLMCALSSEHLDLEIIELLLKNGAKLNISDVQTVCVQNKPEWTLLSELCILFKNRAKKISNNHLSEPLIKATELLLRYGANPNRLRNSGKKISEFAFALLEGYIDFPEILELLLLNGATFTLDEFKQYNIDLNGNTSCKQFTDGDLELILSLFVDCVDQKEPMKIPAERIKNHEFSYLIKFYQKQKLNDPSFSIKPLLEKRQLQKFSVDFFKNSANMTLLSDAAQKAILISTLCVFKNKLGIRFPKPVFKKILGEAFLGNYASIFWPNNKMKEDHEEKQSHLTIEYRKN
ncbi:MAG: ankyrin repeat domain-containing protein [Legionella longbeachae]|nr:ankyrin repeat domain-containing protein [Legionella longbeachae]